MVSFLFIQTVIAASESYDDKYLSLIVFDKASREKAVKTEFLAQVKTSNASGYFNRIARQTKNKNYLMLWLYGKAETHYILKAAGLHDVITSMIVRLLVFKVNVDRSDGNGIGETKMPLISPSESAIFLR